MAGREVARGCHRAGMAVDCRVGAAKSKNKAPSVGKSIGPSVATRGTAKIPAAASALSQEMDALRPVFPRRAVALMASTCRSASA